VKPDPTQGASETSLDDGDQSQVLRVCAANMTVGVAWQRWCSACHQVLVSTSVLASSVLHLKLNRVAINLVSVAQFDFNETSGKVLFVQSRSVLERATNFGPTVRRRVSSSKTPVNSPRRQPDVEKPSAPPVPPSRKKNSSRPQDAHLYDVPNSGAALSCAGSVSSKADGAGFFWSFFGRGPKCV